MDDENNNDIDLDHLKNGLPGISDVLGAYMAEAATFCLDHENHQNGVQLEVNGDFKKSFSINWKGQVTDQIKRSFGDLAEATEFGATGIACLLILKLTEYTIIERSIKGTGFDYWLGDPQNNDNLLEKKARLEISGIQKGNASIVNARLNQKMNQTRQSDSLKLPAYVVIVEFSKPLSKVKLR